MARRERDSHAPRLTGRIFVIVTETGEQDQRRTSRARVAFGRLVVDPDLLPLEEPLELLRAALRPGTAVERHNRLWRMGQWREEDDVIYGRIGFEAAGSPTEIWNENKNDFEERVFPSGVTSPFAIRSGDFRIAFQLRGNTIRRQSFIGAMQALLREASSTYWRIDSLTRDIPFAEWTSTVSRVVSLRFRLEKPNPHYGERDLVRTMVQDAGSVMTNVVMRADEGDLDGINVDSDFVAQCIEHAERYGDYGAVGEREQDGLTERVAWSKRAGELDERTVEADPDTGEIRPTELRNQLASSEADDDPRSGIDDYVQPGPDASLRRPVSGELTAGPGGAEAEQQDEST